MTVPLFHTRAALEPLLDEVAARQRAVLESGRYILGPEVEAFEEEFASAAGARHCVGVASGTDALVIALRALGVGRGDEVIVPSLTYFATAEAVVAAGAVPVFCDIDAGTMVITAQTVAPFVTDRTAAILPVHLFGNPAPIDELGDLARRHGLALLEDAAQAAGARFDARPAGSLGDAAGFSFFPSKNLGGFGDGGAITTDDPDLAARARSLRAHGSADRKLHTEVGYNSRLDESQAAGLRVLLPHLEGWTEARRAAARGYREAGLGAAVVLPEETPGGECCHHLYVVRSRERDRLAEGLAQRGIEARAYYSTPVHRQPAMAPYAPAEPLFETDRAAEEILALPMGPGLGAGDISAIAAAVFELLNGGADGARE